jgi:hypothetical protein
MRVLTPKQRRNQPQTVEVPTVPAGGGTSYGFALKEGLAEVKRAFTAAMRDNDARQAQARGWMDAGLERPTPSGDRQAAQPSQPGHVGTVLGVGMAPGAEPPGLPQAQTNVDLPAPAPPPPRVSASTTRPKGAPGFWFNQHQATRPTASATPIFVTVDEAGGRLGVFGWLRRLFGGGA